MKPSLHSRALRLLSSLVTAMLLLLLVLVGAQMSSLVVAASGLRPLDWRNPPGDPEIGVITLTANIGLSDTAPGGLTKTVYFANKSAGMITVTVAVTGTPPLTLTGGAAFNKTTETVVVSTIAPFEGVITYTVGTNHGVQPGVLFTATSAISIVSVPITFVQDIVTPTGGISSPVAGWITATTLHITGTADDTGAGIQQVEAVTGTGGPVHVAAYSVLDKTWIYTWTVPSENGVAHELLVTMTDFVGNALTDTQIITVDNVAPTAIITTDSHIATTTFSLYWSAQDSSPGSGIRDYEVSYYTATGAAGWQPLQTGGLTTSFLFNAPDDEMSYTFVVTAYDRAGNVDDATWWVHVGEFKIYLPVVLRDYNSFGNGDFSAGLSGWNYGGDNGYTVTPVTRFYKNAQPITGTAALLGGVDSDECRADTGPCYAEGGVPVGSARLWQRFTVPDTSAPKLTIHYRILTRDILRGSVTGKYWDDFEVSVNTTPTAVTDVMRNSISCGNGATSGATLPVTLTGGLVMCDGYTGVWHNNSLIDLGWKTITLDLSNFRGQNITVYFANWNREDPTANTWTYVDDITLTP
jgi:hypothetical protein